MIAFKGRLSFKQYLPAKPTVVPNTLKDYDLTNTFPHPTYLVTTKLLPGDHAMFGAPMQNTSNLHCANLSMVDTGSSSTIISLLSANALGMKTNELIPFTFQMRGPNMEDLYVMGTIIVEIAIKHASGSMQSTCQVCYVSPLAGKSYSAGRPSVHWEWPIKHPYCCSAELQQQLHLWVIPRRTCDPATDEHWNPHQCSPPCLRECLKQGVMLMLSKRGSSTTMSQPKHQPLPLMKGHPWILYTDANSVSVAIHKHTLVPIRWQEKVHMDLEQDVSLGSSWTCKPKHPSNNVPGVT